ncbi:MAG: FAD-binding domain-containing protein, partial [bacterium]
GRSRNFIDGAVTYLSPYISRGVISTRQIMQHVMKKGYKPYQIEKFLQELAWRDYFQRVGQAYPNLINTEIKNQQQKVSNRKMPSSILTATTGITAIDESISGLYEHGYMHNHCRMYVASMICNIGQSHWQMPSKWMYYHLLDADYASNACSWQWVAGAFSSKKYYCNQENINKYCHSDQRNTFLDMSYEELEQTQIPDALQSLSILDQTTKLPEQRDFKIDESLPVMIYSLYNLDPLWRKDEAANRILLLEPSHFKNFPVSQKTIDFLLALANNIPEIQLFIGELKELKQQYPTLNYISKEHPLFNHIEGTHDERDWMCPQVKGYFPSFFAFWKQYSKLMK